MIEIREFRPDDYERVSRLWADCGLHVGLGDEADELAGLPHPQLFVVGVEGERVVAALLATFDGRRGWLHHLAVEPAFQRQGLGRVLVREVERRLAELGCRKVNLLIEPDNSQVRHFYAALGYGRDPLVFMERRLDGDGARTGEAGCAGGVVDVSGEDGS